MVVPRGECQADDRAEAVLGFEAEDAMADDGRLQVHKKGLQLRKSGLP